MDVKEAIERLKLCSTNQCNICGRYEKEECMLERNRCERTVLSELEKQLFKLQARADRLTVELEKKEAIINLMAKQLVEAHGWFYSEFDNFTEKD